MSLNPPRTRFALIHGAAVHSLATTASIPSGPNCVHHIPGLDYSGESRPAGGVGGDFFNFTTIGDEALLACVGDVSAKGLGTAVMMAGIQHCLRGLAAGGETGLSAVVAEINRISYEVSPDNFFATLFYASFDPFRRRLEYVSAGHEPALLIGAASSRIRALERTGPVLGLSTRAPFASRNLSLEAGDVLVAYTDGISAELSEERIAEIVRSRPGAGAGDLVARIMAAAGRSCGGSADDRTVLAVRYKGAAQAGAELCREEALAAG
jgi:sigma-B regulation protein RsbU (phosphoserine phosphatase)